LPLSRQRSLARSLTGLAAGTLLAAAAAPGRAAALRRGLERAGLALLYLALPAWLGWRALSG